MHQQWIQDPASVDSSWRNHFEKGNALPDVDAIMDELSNRGFTPNTATVNQGDINKAQSDSFKVFQLIRAYMTHGHFGADLDPLNMAEAYGEHGVTEKF